MSKTGKLSLFGLLGVVVMAAVICLYDTSRLEQSLRRMVEPTMLIASSSSSSNDDSQDSSDEHDIDRQKLLDENKRLRMELLQLNETMVSAMVTDVSSTLPSLQDNNSNNNDTFCQAEYLRATRNQTQGLSADSIRRSRANWGHPYRLDRVAQVLSHRQRPLQVVAFGGSITKAHGVEHNLSIGSDGYTWLLEEWLNDKYPLLAVSAQQQQHRVHNMAQHGADICHLAKRMTSMMAYLNQTQHMEKPDMILLEFAVNDYQGQDHVHFDVDRLDVFFPGFQDVALCAEAVVYKLLTAYPDAAVMFVEFRSAILQRKTAQMLHMGVAQHYQLPVISYADAVFPEFFNLLYNKLNASDLYTVPIGETVQPFPYGCLACRPETMIEQFRYSFGPTKDCQTACDIMWASGDGCDNTSALPPPGRQHCYPALFSVDNVHPSALGHAIATDLIASAIATAVKDRCDRQQISVSAIERQLLPSVGWLGTPNALLTRSNFVLVQDADCLAEFCHGLPAEAHSPGFALTSDFGGFVKVGWIATNTSGGEWVEFDIDLPERPCYVVFMAILRSYWNGMGMMQVTVIDKQTGTETSVELDSLWEPKISVWSDNQITSDETPACTGKCLVRVQTLPQDAGRDGNKAKILTLSVRECIRP